MQARGPVTDQAQEREADREAVHTLELQLCVKAGKLPVVLCSNAGNGELCAQGFPLLLRTGCSYAGTPGAEGKNS
eukprot:389930-Amphidinium_carterae.1